jgi:hypothetical protein
MARASRVPGVGRCDLRVFDPIQQRRFDEAFDGSGPLQVDGPKFAVKGNYVVHFVRMTFPVEEFPIS